jgi:hypothetical protein
MCRLGEQDSFAHHKTPLGAAPEPSHTSPLKSWRENSPKSADIYDSILRRTFHRPADARRTDGHGRAAAPRGGLMNEPAKSARAKASRIGLPSLCKFDDLLRDRGRSPRYPGRAGYRNDGSL